MKEDPTSLISRLSWILTSIGWCIYNDRHALYMWVSGITFILNQSQTFCIQFGLVVEESCVLVNNVSLCVSDIGQ